MEDDRFDALARRLASGLVSRRRAIGGGVGSGLALALGRGGRVETEDAAAARCLKQGKRCGRDTQCCSGVCRRKSCRRAAGQATCTTNQDFCKTGSAGSGCGTNGNGGDPCNCFVTPRGDSFCGVFAAATCAPCANDRDCDVVTGPGSRCLPSGPLCGTACDEEGNTFCIPRCATD